MNGTSYAMPSPSVCARASSGVPRCRARDMQAVQDECAVLAQALHDDLAQLLSFALIQLDIAQAASTEPGDYRDAALRHGRDLIKDALRTTRDVIGSLLDAAQPTAPTFDAQCLLLAGEIGRITRQTIDVDCAPITAAPPPAVATVLLRAIRELLANAGKHAPGARVRLSLRQDTQHAGGIVLAVSDNGPGFDPQCARPTARGHCGLHRLPAALRKVGAQFTLHARPGLGVRAHIRWSPRLGTASIMASMPAVIKATSS
ncbi:sensor histidine kinase [Cupriavidus pampae]|nr:ATP-binding protein [Cupriavidus pampae]